MQRIHLIASAATLLLASAAVWAQAPGIGTGGGGAGGAGGVDNRPTGNDNTDIFTERMKLGQHATRVLKVRADRAAVPFGNATLSALLNTRTVGGAAAQTAFKLSPERYSSVIRVQAEVEPGGEDALMVRLDLYLRADRHVDDATFDRFTLALKNQLLRELRAALDDEKVAVQRHREQVLARRQDLAAQLEDLRQQRLELTEAQGLAAEPQALVQGALADLVSRQQAIESHLAAKTARKEFLQTQVADAKGAAAKPDPVAVALKSLVEARTKQVQALAASKAKPDAVAVAEALLAEAELRQSAYQRELAGQSPAEQIAQLEADIADLQGQQRFTHQKIADLQAHSGERFRAGELVIAVQGQEQALAQRIADLDKQADALADRAEKLVINGASVLGIPGEEPASSHEN
jgi:hypothetical protein